MDEILHALSEPHEAEADHDPAQPITFGHVRGRRTVDYLLHNTQQHLVTLSAQADLKANIIITVSTLVLTLGVNKLRDPQMRVSMLILSIGCLISLVLAVLTVLPTATFRRRLKRTNQLNPLFFMDAAAFTKEAYMQRLAETCKDDGSVYELQVDDIHDFSVFLARSKFLRLRLAYTAFLTTVIVAGTTQMIKTFL